MGSTGRIDLKTIRRMLEACVPGTRLVEKTHHLWIYPPSGPYYPSLPRGEHGTRQNPEIEVGHVRKMARFLGILKCAQREIENL
jgi:hypothetical protein